MAAIITENYRKFLTTLLKQNIQSGDDVYYVGIGKSDAWYEDLSGGLTAPFPQGTSGDGKTVLSNLTDLIKIGGDSYSRVMPNVNPITVGSYYKKYDAYDATCLYPETIDSIEYKPAYFIEPASGNVFLVIDTPSPPAPLTIIDDGTDDTYDFLLNGNDGPLMTSGRPIEMKTVSGYTIVLIGSTPTYSKFNNTQFVEVKDDLLVDPPTYADYTGHNYRGIVYGFHVANGGLYKQSNANYTGPANATVRVYESSTNTLQAPLEIQVQCSIVNGKITSVKPLAAYYNTLASQVGGRIFNNATAEIVITTNGIVTNAPPTIYPCISNINGFKYDITQYTPSWYACFLVNSDVSDQDVYTSYSQVSLIRNPLLVGNNNVLNVASRSMKKSFTLLNYPSPNIDSAYSIVQKNTQNQIVKRIGVVDSYKQVGANTVVYYTSSAKYGYDVPMVSAGAISFIEIVNDTSTPSEINTSIAPSSINAQAIDTADVLFIDNRGKINRADDQNEELKIIIQL
jgi:hypothetical protein